MNPLRFLFILLVLGSFLTIASADDSPDGSFVVVELFSSEGCSDCPAADLLVSKLTAWARENKEPVYPLIFHVDYWNNLGWRDVFSRQEYTQRQNKYAHVISGQGLYTPEMIVNGTEAFVGSDQDQLQRALNRGLTMPGSVILNVNSRKKDDQIIVNYSSAGFTTGDVINFALVQRGLITEVTAGENAGRTLHHDNVVRAFQTAALTKGHAQVTIPLGRINDLSQASVIAYVQDPLTMKIKAAKQVDLENDQ